MVKPDIIVIDVGCTFVNGFARGDIDIDSVYEVANASSPVPGGVGPMTVAMVIENTWKAFKIQHTQDTGIKNNAVSFRYR